ncbi:hypothetical protein AURDEDRAFT_182920 [Auricularia subglabra TFB-10046 SS5]|nr:hypothetical protein AURDEDRAFT_182920 [Auricularia subglabra TFB-10046 SS5]
MTSRGLNGAHGYDTETTGKAQPRTIGDHGDPHHPGSPSGTAHRGPSPSQTIRSSSVATLSADSHASPGGSNAGYEIYPENGRNAFGFEWTIPSEAEMASLRPGERRRWVDYARKCQVFDPNGVRARSTSIVLPDTHVVAQDGPAPTPVGYGLSATPSPVPSRLASPYAPPAATYPSPHVPSRLTSPYAPPAATYPSPHAHAGHFSPQPSASQYTHSATASRASSAGLTPGPDFMLQPTHNRWASPSPSVYAESAATSRASSASLTPEPEQRFQCPDCSVDFGCRDWLHLHLRGQYKNGVCPSSY